MSNKADIFLGLQYRDKFSVGQNRIRLGKRAFHWSIIVAVDDKYHRFDVTDGVIQDPVTFQDTNPDRVWVHRHNVSEALLEIPRYLGSIQINHKAINVNIDELGKLFDDVPMPDIHGERVLNNCVTWTIDAVRALQKAGYCQSFDLDNFQEYALKHADRRLADFKNRPDPVRYPQSGNRWLRLF